MDSPAPEMPFLKNIGLLMTLQCQIACPHCIIEAGPHRKEQMLLQDAFSWIEQIASYRDGHIRVVSLTGGEPFIDQERLKAISEFANRNRLFVSAVTNAYWASTLERAVRILEGLPALKMIQISADVYHQKFIPFEWVENAVTAARVCNVPFTLAVCTENDKDPDYLAIMRQLREIAEPELIYTAVTFRAGRALKKGNNHNYETSAVPPLTSCGAGSSPIIFPDGRVIACIGPIVDLTNPHPLVLGNLRQNPLTEILDNAELNSILHAIRIWGPQKVIALSQEAGLGPYLPEQYIKDSVCHACYELMSRPKITRFLQELAQNAEFTRMVAYGRVYYLKETEMVMGLGLKG